MKKIVFFVIRFLQTFISIRKELICIRSLPNFSDEVYWISEYVKNNDLKLVILYDDDSTTPIWADADHIIRVKYKSIKGIFYFIKASLVIYTHGIYSFMGKKIKGVTLNIWHGMPLKKIGAYRNIPMEELPKFDIILADREEFVPVMTKSFCVDNSSVIISPSPRIDSLSHDIVNQSFSDHDMGIVILWLPTFRNSYRGKDGDFLKLPFINDEQLTEISSKLKEYNAICYVKVHPLSDDDFSKIEKYENFRLLKDNSTKNDKEKSLYSRVRESDIIITDYSSIMFDLDHIEKEVLLYTPDLREYKQSVGFIDSVLADVEANFIIDFKEFLNCLDMEMSKLVDNSINDKVDILNRGYWTNEMFQKLHKNVELS